jgi:hypothetical protein
VNDSNFSPASLAAGLVLVAFGAWILAGGVTFDALWPALVGAVGLILLGSGLGRRR